ncbi:MAG: ABC transporter substrate-binding protein [Candidatus Korobacteraceae bacterium]|jgi:branched-chain amino acid transport system substrate-binding protein
MKRSAVVICMFLLFAACTWSEAQEITIGVNFSTTGPAASLGIPNQNALLLAPHVIGGQKVRYIFLDDTSDPTLALQNVKRLISQDNIDVLIGPSITPTTLAVIETIAAAKVPMIALGSTSRLILPMDEKKKWVFKTVPNDDIFAGALVDLMAKQGVKTMGMIAVNDPYGESWTEIITQLAAAKGIKILNVEKFNRDDTSATGPALRAMSGHPDAIVIAAVGTPAVTPSRDLIERGYKGKIFHCGGMVNGDFLRVGGKAVEGIYTPTPPLVVTEQLPDGYATKKAGLEFLKIYEAKYGPGSRSQYAGHSWDAIKVLEVAIPVALKKGKPGTLQFREALRDAIENVKHVHGVQARYNMTPADHSGIDKRGIVMVKVENGTWKLVDYPKF